MTQPCDPPHHWWDITDVTRVSVGKTVLVPCTCAQTTVQAERTVDGWETRLVEPGRYPLFSQNRRDKHPLGANDELLIAAKVSLAGEAPGSYQPAADGEPGAPSLGATTEREQ